MKRAAYYKFNFLFILLIALYNLVLGQAKTDLNLQFKNASYSVYTVKIDTSSIKKFSVTPNYVGLTYKDFTDEFIANHDSDFFCNKRMY